MGGGGGEGGFSCRCDLATLTHEDILRHLATTACEDSPGTKEVSVRSSRVVGKEKVKGKMAFHTYRREGKGWQHAEALEVRGEEEGKTNRG